LHEAVVPMVFYGRGVRDVLGAPPSHASVRSRRRQHGRQATASAGVDRQHNAVGYLVLAQLGGLEGEAGPTLRGGLPGMVGQSKSCAGTVGFGTKIR
jgi:hypothetical protein